VKVLVTGAGGMLAQALLPVLEASGHPVLALTRADADISRVDALAQPIRSFRPDWVVNLAAFTRVDDCERQIDEAFRVNAIAARSVAVIAAAAGVPLMTISTDYVFDGEGKRPYRESDAPGPRSVYGRSKLAGEQAVREVQPRHQIVRTAWLYGHGGRNFVDTILEKARAGEALRVVDDQRGSPTYAADLADGLLRLLNAGQFGTYHVTNSGDCTWYDLAVYVLDRAGVRVEVTRTDSASFPRPAPRPAYSVLDNQRYEQVTRHRMPSWQDAVDRYLGIGAASARGVERRA
jgi:dTDP-4-dehydrorhamnose reductase